MSSHNTKTLGQLEKQGTGNGTGVVNGNWNRNGNGNGNRKLKITIPLACVKDGRSVDSDSSSVNDRLTFHHEAAETSSISDKNVPTDRSAWTILIVSQANNTDTKHSTLGQGRLQKRNGSLPWP